MDITKFLRLLDKAVVNGDAGTVSILQAYADAQAAAVRVVASAMRKVDETSYIVRHVNEDAARRAPPTTVPKCWSAPELLEAHRLGHKIRYRGNGEECKRMEAPTGKNHYAEAFDMVVAYLPSYPNGLLTDASSFLVVPKDPNA